MSMLSEDKVRVPVKLVDGKWEFFYGGETPIAEGAFAEIVVEKAKITDPGFLARLKKKSSYKIMGPDTKLMVALTIKNQRVIVKSGVWPSGSVPV